MDSAKRFDQLESLLVDMARKQDQQAGQIAQIIEELNRQGEAIGYIGQRLNGIDQRLEGIDQRLEGIDQRLGGIDQQLEGIGEQVDAIINIFKISEARHTQAEQRQDAMLLEIRENGREIKEQGQRLDAALNVQLQMLQLMRAGNDKSDDLAQRLAPLEDQEPRIKRLEDEVFRAAS